MILRAENIMKAYRGRKVVKGISLEVRQGEIVGLLGPNGAGKTTSFYMIVGLIKPNGGKIFLNDIDDIEQIINKKMTDNLAEIERTQSWYTELITDFVCRNDCLQYLGENEDHKSRVASLRFLYVVGYGSIIDDYARGSSQHCFVASR